MTIVDVRTVWVQLAVHERDLLKAKYKTIAALNAAKSADVRCGEPRMRAGGAPWIRDARRTAMAAGSPSNAPAAQPSVSTRVRFTW